MSDVWELLHVLAGFWLVAGIVGRTVTLAQARKQTEIGRIEALLGAADRFETLMVIPGSIAVLVLGLVTMAAQGRSLLDEGNRWLPTALTLFLLTAALVPTVFLPRGKVFDAALEEAKAAGQVTPALTAAFADPMVALARAVEAVLLAVVIGLMVLKPF
jgi:NADH:ubiquinone oxidoreductase subunit 6 (subunit J)